MTKKSTTVVLPKKSAKNPSIAARKLNYVQRLQNRARSFLSRRPHRSFRRTYRRDYVRPLKLPGYWAFTIYVLKYMWGHKRIFIPLTLVYALLCGVLVGMASQDSYSQLGDILRQTGGQVFTGHWGSVGEASLLLASIMSGSIDNTLTDIQWLYTIILVLMTWLTTVWLLRAIVAGKKPRLRDGLYNSGSPILATFMVALVIVAQLVPVAIAVVAIGAGLSNGVMSFGVVSMLLWIAALLLAVLSLYWITSTLLAMVVVTLPGMYPMQAIKTAGDLVIGRRIRILFRLLWLAGLSTIGWALVMIPIIILDTWISGAITALRSVPVVPFVILILGSMLVVWVASYIYLLYRKVVDDGTAPV